MDQPLDWPEIAAYLARIGFTGAAPKPTKETLLALTQAHLHSVPYENLDIFDFKREISIEPEALFDKIVRRRRGGYCFELNGLFYTLLTALGFACYPVAVRILWGRTDRPAWMHRAAIVVLDGEKLFCDVGFGGPGPREVLPLSQRIPLDTRGGRFFFAPRGNEMVLVRLDGETANDLLTFRDEPFEQKDFEVLNYYYSVNPVTRFHQHRIVNLCRADGYYSLLDQTLTISGNGQKRVIELADMQAVETAIRTFYDMDVTLQCAERVMQR